MSASNGRLDGAERIFRAYGELRLALAFTEGIEGDAAKRIRGSWNRTKPLAGADFAAPFAERCKRHNPAVVLGASGLIGIDVDGEEGLKVYRNVVGRLPSTISVRTGGGCHLWFAPPEGAPPVAAFEFCARGVTARADAYFVAPPAVHTSGRVYEFLPGKAPWDIGPPVELPLAAFEAMRHAAGLRRRVSPNGAAGEPILQGERNDALFRTGCAMRRRGLGEAAILAALQADNAARCRPPLADDEVATIARSATGYAPGDLSSLTSLSSPSQTFNTSWPAPLDESAFHGLAGDFVHLLEPHTEADPAALLGQFLVGVGSVIGRAPHVSVGADRHGVNLSASVVGDTSRGRKGTAEGWVRALLERVDPAWGDDRVQTGLSSGEGLIHAVRDAARGEESEVSEESPPSRGRKRGDLGVADKRLLAIEPEFSRVLRNASRQGNTLSAQLRQAWDAPRVMRTMTRTSPLKATDAHVSVIGHITVDELRADLTRTDTANGFANRFLWVAARRSKLLPRGGSLHPDELEPLAERLRLVVDWAQGQRRLAPDGGYWQLWEDTYAALTADVPGLLGAATSRAEAQVTRLALLYALLELSDVVGRKHLEAALAFWRYCERSAAYIFGDSLGDPAADEILGALRRSENGLTRWDISNLFGRHRSSADIGRALDLLRDNGLATAEPETTGGRSAERWRATS